MSPLTHLPQSFPRVFRWMELFAFPALRYLVIRPTGSYTSGLRLAANPRRVFNDITARPILLRTLLEQTPVV